MHIRVASPYPAPSIQFSTDLPIQLPASVPQPQAWLNQIETLAQHSNLLPKPRAQPQSNATEQARSSLEFSRTRKEDLFDEYHHDEGEPLPADYLSHDNYDARCTQTRQEARTEAEELLPFPASVHALDRSASLSSLLRAVEFELFSSPEPTHSPLTSNSSCLDRFDFTGCVARIWLFDQVGFCSPSPVDFEPALVLHLPRECAEMLSKVVQDVAESGRWDAEGRRRNERERKRDSAKNEHSEHDLAGKRGRSRQRGRARTRSVSESRLEHTGSHSEDVCRDGERNAEEDGECDIETETRSKGKKSWHRRARSLSVVGMGLVSFFGSIVESLSRPSSPPPPESEICEKTTMTRSHSLSRTFFRSSVSSSAGDDDVEKQGVTERKVKKRPSYLGHSRARSTSSLPSAKSLIAPIPLTSGRASCEQNRVAFPTRYSYEDQTQPVQNKNLESEVERTLDVDSADSGPDPHIQSRILRRRARARLLDTFRQFVTPAVNSMFVGWLESTARSRSSSSRYKRTQGMAAPFGHGLPEFGLGFAAGLGVGMGLAGEEFVGMFDLPSYTSQELQLSDANNGPHREGGYVLWVLGLALRKVGREVRSVQHAIEEEQIRVQEYQRQMEQQRARERERERHQRQRKQLENVVGYAVTSIGGKISPSQLEESPFVSDSSSGRGEGDEDGSSSSETDGSSVHTPQELYAFGENVDVVEPEPGASGGPSMGMSHPQGLTRSANDLRLLIGEERGKEGKKTKGKKGRRHRRRREHEHEHEHVQEQSSQLPNPYDSQPLLSPFIPAQAHPSQPISPITSVFPSSAYPESPCQPHAPFDSASSNLPVLAHRLTHLSSLHRSLTSLVTSSMVVLTHAASERTAQLAVLEVRARRRAWSMTRLGGRAELKYAGTLGRPGVGSKLRDVVCVADHCECDRAQADGELSTSAAAAAANASMKVGKGKGKKTKRRRRTVEKMESISEDEEDEFEFEFELEEVESTPSPPSTSTSPQPFPSLSASDAELEPDASDLPLHASNRLFDGPQDVSPPLSPPATTERVVPFPSTPEPEVLDDFDFEPPRSSPGPPEDSHNHEVEDSDTGDREDFCSTGPQDTLPLFGGPIEFGCDDMHDHYQCTDYDTERCAGCDSFDDEDYADGSCGYLPISRSSASMSDEKGYVDPLDVDIEAQAGFEWPYAYVNANGGGFTGPGYASYTYGHSSGKGHGAGSVSVPIPLQMYDSPASPGELPPSLTPSSSSSSLGPLACGNGEEFTLALDVPSYMQQQHVRRTPRGRGHRRAITLATFVPPS